MTSKLKSMRKRLKPDVLILVADSQDKNRKNTPRNYRIIVVILIDVITKEMATRLLRNEAQKLAP